MTQYYFVRVNGDTAHNNPRERGCFMRGEPPNYPQTFFNYLQYCLDEGIIRIGWPNTGDLRRTPPRPILRGCYTFEEPDYVSDYLEAFRDMPQRSVVLMPDKAHPGDLYIGEITGPYDFTYDPPRHPFENAHRHPVRWDRRNGEPILYSASECSIGIHGGFWRQAFAHLNAAADADRIIQRIDAARRNKRGRS